MDSEVYRKRYASRPPQLLAREVERLEKRFQGFQEQLPPGDPRLTDAMNEWQGAMAALAGQNLPPRR